MDEELNIVIKALAQRSLQAHDAGDSMKLTQAALNLAHVVVMQADIRHIDAETERLEISNGKFPYTRG